MELDCWDLQERHAEACAVIRRRRVAAKEEHDEELALERDKLAGTVAWLEGTTRNVTAMYRRPANNEVTAASVPPPPSSLSAPHLAATKAHTTTVIGIIDDARASAPTSTRPHCVLSQVSQRH